MSSPYSATLLQHFRNPRNYGSLERPDASHEVLNPLCGDRIRLELRVEGGAIEAVRFRGDACAICIAAASLMTEMIEGRATAAAGKLAEKDLLDALRTPVPAPRRRCALLPLEALSGCLRLLRAGQHEKANTQRDPSRPAG